MTEMLDWLIIVLIPPEDVSSPVHHALHKRLVFKFQLLQQQATPIETRWKDSFKIEITWKF